MRKLLLALAALAAALAVPLSIGSSHREAPRILKDPTADNTDVWAFTAPDAPGSLTVVANWIPLADPAGGPNFYPLDENARYYVKIDNTGDGTRTLPTAGSSRPGSATRTRSCTRHRRSTRSTIRTSTSSRRYDLYKERYNENRRLVSVKRSRTTRRSCRTTSARRRCRTSTRSRPVAPLAGGRRKVVRRPRRRRLLRRPRRGLRRHQHRQARPSEHRPREPRRRQGRRGRLQHQVVRAAGARARGHSRPQGRRGSDEGQRGRRCVVHDRAQARLRFKGVASTAQGPAGCRSAGLAIPSSTR